MLAWFLGERLIYGAALSALAGFWAARGALRDFHSTDPKLFVMDEVCGMMLTLLWLPKNVSLYVAAFILFRVLDIWKPGPIAKINDNHRASSIMWDDVVAGILGNLILQAVIRTEIIPLTSV